MNVLLTCAGRRVSLLRAFQQAVAPYHGTVVAADHDPLAPAMRLAAHRAQVPLLSDAAYLPALLDLVRVHQIRLLVPTIDTELPLLAEAVPQLAALRCQAAISTLAFIERCADKYQTAVFWQKQGFRTVPTWLPGQLPDALPVDLFVKPRRGAASKKAFRVSAAQLDHALALVPDPIVQPFIDAPEITIDALFDFSGRLLHYLPRLRLRTLAGESIQGVTIDDAPFRARLRALLETAGADGARGPITVQAFQTEKGLMLSEINPRFGGGFPLAAAAGAHYPRWLVQMVRGETPDARCGTYQRGRTMTRYYAELFELE